jgi:hypothetical protein
LICTVCRREFPEDLNELDSYACGYCDEVLCSDDCLTEHVESAHAEEAVAAPPEDEERR